MHTPLFRWARLMVGLFGCGLAAAIMIRSRLGLGPWDAFHVGLHNLGGITVGVASILTGLVIIVGTSFIGVRPGAGTLVNMVMIGVFMDLLLPAIPDAPNRVWGFGYYVAAIGIFGLATGAYLGARLGSGPRDGLMIAISERLGWSIQRTRTLVELLVLAAGWLMGGQVGIGTILFALTIGPAMQWGMKVGGVLPKRVHLSLGGIDEIPRPGVPAAAHVRDPALER